MCPILNPMLQAADTVLTEHFNIYEQENSIIGLCEPKKTEFLYTFILMNI